MDCPSCGHQNPADADFCEECAAEFLRACAGCGTANTATAKFCKRCRASLTESAVTGGEAGAEGPPSAPSVPLPESVGAGRYEVRAFAGEGGTKRVYLAHDTKLDRDVAVALIKTEGLDAEGVLRVRREAQSMARLGDHPAIVTIYDIGDDAGQDGRRQPYIVSQHMPRGSVEDALRATEDHRLPIDDALRIARDVCDALEHAHGQGIVHRDLKPGNVYLNNDGAAKLGDFGLAVSLDKSRLTIAGMMVGTVAYMAPEQALGGTPDARSDLYALGAALYEMTTGRPPFVGDDAVAVISQHINTPPLSPAWLNPEVPAWLDTLILRLLEKDPARRPQLATEVRELLKSGASAAPSGASDVAPAPAPAVTANPLYQKAFVGREAEMRQLHAAFDAALSGEGALMMVVGEPGIGKTSVCEQLATYAALRGGRHLVGHCYEEGSLSLPYLPFVEAMRTLVLTSEPDDLKRELGSGAAEVARIVSEIRERVEVEPALAAEPEEERYRLLQSVTAFLRNAAVTRPLLIVLEDLHDADRGTLDLLTHVARSLAGARLLVVGTYRDVEVDRTHPLSGALVELRRATRFERVALRGLTADEVHRMLMAIGRQEVQRSVAEAVHGQTEGNPLFVQELRRSPAAKGLIAREGGRYERTTPDEIAFMIPEGLRDTIGKRLSRLSAECNKLLAIAAVAGRDFALATLRTVAAVPEDDLLAALEEAVRVGVLEERSRGSDVRYRFTHAFFRQSLYEELIAPRRIRMHQQVARALEEQYAGRLEEHAAELADHFSYSSDAADLAKCVSYGEMAAQRASAVYAHAEAASLLQRALDVQEVLDPDDHGRRCDLLVAQVVPLQHSGSMDAARDVCFAAADLARAAGDKRRLNDAALAAVETEWSPTLDLRMRRLLDDVLAAADPSDAVTQVRLRIRLVTEGVTLGVDDNGARTLAQEALELARQSGDRNLIAAGLMAAGFSLRPDQFERRGELALEMETFAEGSNRFRVLQTALVIHGNNAMSGNDLAEAKLRVDALQALAERHRISLSIVRSTLWQAELERIAGGFDQANKLLAQAMDTAGLEWMGREHADIHAGNDHVFMLRAQQGRVAEVEQAFRDFLPISREALRLPRAVFAFAQLGRLDECRVALDELMSVGLTELSESRFWAASAPALSEACIALADRNVAAELYPYLIPWAGRNLMRFGSPPVFFGPVDRYLGGLAALLERWDDAERHFEETLDMTAALPLPPYLAQTQHDYARMLIARDAPGDRRRALSLLADAGATARRIGMKKLLDEVLALRIEAQGLSSTDVMTSISAVASAAQRDLTDLRPLAAPDGSVTIMFSDIEGSTTINERLGDGDYMELLRAHNGFMREQLKSHGGHEVKKAGDGFMVAFSSPLRAVECAISIQRAFAAHNERHSKHPLRVRIGLHTGTPVAEGGDYYGTDVTLAFRIADSAEGGEIVISARLRELIGPSSEVKFGEPRKLKLKGLAGTHTVYIARSA